MPSKEPPQSPPKQPGGAELRRNPATGTVVLIAPERLARLRTDPFRLSQAGLHEFPVFDEEGGLAWRDLHKATFERLKGLAAKLTRPMHISTRQDACLLFNEGDGDGLPMHERSTMPYVCRLIASELPPEQKPLLLGAAGKCPFCAFCLSDVAKPGETVKLDAALCEDTLVLRSPDGEILSTLLQNTPDYLRYFDQPTSLYPSCLEQLAPSLRTYLKSEVCTELSTHQSCTWLCRVVDQKFPALRPKSSGTDDDGHVRYDTFTRDGRPSASTISFSTRHGTMRTAQGYPSSKCTRSFAYGMHDIAPPPPQRPSATYTLQEQWTRFRRLAASRSLAANGPSRCSDA